MRTVKIENNGLIDTENNKAVQCPMTFTDTTICHSCRTHCAWFSIENKVIGENAGTRVPVRDILAMCKDHVIGRI